MRIKKVSHHAPHGHQDVHKNAQKRNLLPISEICNKSILYLYFISLAAYKKGHVSVYTCQRLVLLGYISNVLLNLIKQQHPIFGPYQTQCSIKSVVYVKCNLCLKGNRNEADRKTLVMIFDLHLSTNLRIIEC